MCGGTRGSRRRPGECVATLNIETGELGNMGLQTKGMVTEWSIMKNEG